ncbi:DUF4352 domain-containing protein [Serpentinicella sp. ANB-PHB4]|uniref:DUF4352 domain-containing protein n=1 Tax=Serpentinicella sp. ANB-PHB4 TaxID=3074076 RepID=UPI00285E90A5|nr:DUF4352 domain-containing protein [Serpentinicella sp. ANB-PHB4]MDR5659013.1 DUF4352 domain-containing protein [Serpentinicella sp. ANB-PHB4]
MKKVLLALLLVLSMTFIVACEDSTPTKVDDNDQSQETSSEEETPAAENFEIGDKVEIGGINITVNSVRWDEGAEFFGPDEGEKWLAIDVTLENTKDESANVSSMLMFDLYDEDNYKRDLALSTTTEGSLDGELGAGRSMRGEIAFSVKEGQNNFEFIFEPNVFGNGQAIFDIEIE